MKVAVIGVGQMGRRHVQVVQELGLSLVGICDQNSDALKICQQENNVSSHQHYTRVEKMLEKTKPDFVEIKAFMAVGYSRQRLAYDRMPLHNEIMEFSKKLAKLTGLKILDHKKESRVAVLGKNKKELKIKAL